MTEFDIEASIENQINLDAIFLKELTIEEPVPSWQWASENVDYSKAGSYDTPYRGMFDPELLPFWKEPLEEMQNINTREVVVLKCSRAGYSENLLLTDLRYTIAKNPEPTMYITGSMEVAKGFHDRRVCRGMTMSKETEKAFRSAKIVNTEIQFPEMDFRSTWNTSSTATKSDGWARLYCDEVSLWGEFGVDMVRRRASAYPFHHICYGGSIDPTRKGNPDEDPVFKLYLESTKGLWMMDDPGGGDPFFWNMNGIKWDPGCKVEDDWDLNAVEQSAFYQAPSGEVITEKQRMEVSRNGRWEHQSEGIRKGYKVTAPMVPFADCSFGQIAKKFLSAKNRMNLTGNRQDRSKNTVRVFFAEHWAEPHRDEEQVMTSEKLKHCEAEYEIGNVWIPGGLESGVFITVDVQKFHLWWVARNWAYDTSQQKAVSTLLSCGTAPSFPDLDSMLAEFSPAQVGIDIGYALRASEVMDYCASYTDTNPKESCVMALRGSDAMKATPLQYTIRDASEGRAVATGLNPYLEITWATDVFRHWLMDNMKSGEDWKIPNDWGAHERHQIQYVKQVTSTKKVDGEWVSIRKDDHLFDCETMQFVLARWDGLI